MNRQIFGVALSAMLLALSVSAEAQPAKKIPRIGYLGDGSAGSRGSITLEPFREGLRELGYVEGQNILIEVRWTDSKSDRLPELVGELIVSRLTLL
jgi:putative ABC transport system substrate-binding protein